MNKLDLFNSKQGLDNKFKDIKPGWTIRIHQKIKEGAKTRVQAFEGIVISRKHGNTASGTIAVRRVAGGFGVEKTYPIYLPSVDKVEVVRETKVRRAKLYYLREKSAREIRRKIRAEQKPTHLPAGRQGPKGSQKEAVLEQLAQ